MSALAYFDALSIISWRSFFSLKTATSFAFASTSTVRSRPRQRLGEIAHVDEVVVPFGPRSVPPFERAGDVEKRLPVPGGDGLLGGLLPGQSVAVAAVVMHVVDQGQPLGTAERQQIRRRVRSCRRSRRSAGSWPWATVAPGCGQNRRGPSRLSP